MTKKREPADPGRSLLGGYLAGFSRWMEEHGYAASTVEQYRVIGRRFDGYLTDHEIDVRGLDEGHVDGYLKQVEPLRPNGQQAVVAEYYCRACRLLIKYLREQGAAAAPVAPPAPGPAILRDYLSFLSDHRALATTSIAEHERWLLRLFAHLGFEGEAVELRELPLSQIDPAPDSLLPPRLRRFQYAPTTPYVSTPGPRQQGTGQACCSSVRA